MTHHRLLLIACVLLTGGCSQPVLEKNAEGWVSYQNAEYQKSLTERTPVSFIEQNGCVLIELETGERYIPIMPEGREFVVQPRRSLFTGEWLAEGVDTANPALQSLQDDPVAQGCDAPPAFVNDFTTPPAPEPPGPATPSS